MNEDDYLDFLPDIHEFEQRYIIKTQYDFFSENKRALERAQNDRPWYLFGFKSLYEKRAENEYKVFKEKFLGSAKDVLQERCKRNSFLTKEEEDLLLKHYKEEYKLPWYKSLFRKPTTEEYENRKLDYANKKLDELYISITQFTREGWKERVRPEFIRDANAVYTAGNLARDDRLVTSDALPTLPPQDHAQEPLGKEGDERGSPIRGDGSSVHSGTNYSDFTDTTSIADAEGKVRDTHNRLVLTLVYTVDTTGTSKTKPLAIIESFIKNDYKIFNQDRQRLRANAASSVNLFSKTQSQRNR